jgi:hypothetical protein
MTLESTKMADTRHSEIPEPQRYYINRIRIFPTKFAFKDHFIVKLLTW